MVANFFMAINPLRSGSVAAHLDKRHFAAISLIEVVYWRD
jgi:hypothetical protein